MAGLRCGKPPDKSEHMIGADHHRKVAGETVEDISSLLNIIINILQAANDRPARQPLAPLPANLSPSIGPTSAPSSSSFPSRSRRTTARRGSAGRRKGKDRPEEKTRGASAAPSPGDLLHDDDLLFRQPVKLVNQGVDLPVGAIDLPRKEGHHPRLHQSQQSS